MKKKIFSLVIIVFCLFSATLNGADNDLKIPGTVFKDKTLVFSESAEVFDSQMNKVDKYTFNTCGIHHLYVEREGVKKKIEVFCIPGLLTILPPLLTIALALITKEIVISLFLGILAGAVILHRYDFIAGFFSVVDEYIITALADKDRSSIIVFTMLLGGMVGIISRSGGVKGIVNKLAGKVKSPRTTQFYTWLMGIMIFFDDYTNTLVVGNTMRALTDKWNVSREKLAYIVDSTAAPMASVALISTWIGFEVSLIDQSVKAYGLTGADAYSLLLSSIPYRFYSILALLFVFTVFMLKRDFGPMIKAEQRARGGAVLSDKAVPISDFEASGLMPDENVKPRWFNGIIPIAVVILFTFCGLYISGKSALSAEHAELVKKSFADIMSGSEVFRNLGTIISSADSFKVLLWASVSGVVCSALLSVFQRILKIRECVDAFVSGMKSMIMAIIILVLAWSLGVVLVNLNTADYFVSFLSSNLDYHFFPAIVFIFSALIAFSTGTSWGTIAIMFPLVLPVIIVMLTGSADLNRFMILTISSVLAGSVFGDHCSPISDTTIMSSLASSCDHIDHVKTQIPYALTCAAAALFLCILPVSFGMPYFLCLIIATLVLVFIVRFAGKVTD